MALYCYDNIGSSRSNVEVYLYQWNGVTVLVCLPVDVCVIVVKTAPIQATVVVVVVACVVLVFGRTRVSNITVVSQHFGRIYTI